MAQDNKETLRSKQMSRVKTPHNGVMGTYTCTEFIMAGAFGDVYKATAVLCKGAEGWIPSVVAVKFIDPFMSDSKDVIKLECNAFALSSSSFVSVYDVISSDADCGVVMELMDKNLVRYQADSWETMSHLMSDMLIALAELCEKGIVHYDIAERNIMLVQVPRRRMRFKICDFGMMKKCNFEFEYGNYQVAFPEFERCKMRERGTPAGADSTFVLMHEFDVFAMGSVLELILERSNLPADPRKKLTEDTIKQMLTQNWKKRPDGVALLLDWNQRGGAQFRASRKRKFEVE